MNPKNNKNQNHNANVINQNPPSSLLPPVKPSRRSPNGKVARLPAIVRQVVNEMLYDGFTYNEIISMVEKLGFPGLNHQNISRWKCGFHQRWLCQHEARQRSLHAARRIPLPLGGEGQGEGVAPATASDVPTSSDPALIEHH